VEAGASIPSDYQDHISGLLLLEWAS